MISGAAGLDHGPLRELLAEEGWEEVPLGTGPQYVDYMCMEQLYARFDKAAYAVRAFIKNIINNDKKTITDKEQLYLSMAAKYPALTRAHMASTANLMVVTSVPAGQALILRPVGETACGGRDIKIVDNVRDLAAAKSLLSKYPSAIASTYIKNPMLWQGRKFHLRMYLLVNAGPAVPFSSQLWHRGKILTAAKPYREDCIDDPGIHDTHADSTPRDLWFPEDFPVKDEVEEVVVQMSEIMACAAELLRPLAKPYEESENAFEVFGVDFLVTDDIKVILIEINNRVGYDPCGNPPDYNPITGPWTQAYTQFSQDYFQWVYEEAIRPVMAAKGKLKNRR